MTGALKKQRFALLFICIATLFLTVTLLFVSVGYADTAYATTEEHDRLSKAIIDGYGNKLPDGNYGVNADGKLTESVLGIGGGGAVFTPRISPFDENELSVTVDMGGVYVSHNAGGNWQRKNLNGQALTAYYDPTSENTLYAGGSGLYKSTDKGDNFELFFPNKNDLTASLSNAENNMRYLYTQSGIYPTNKVVKDVAVNPGDGKNVFILMFSGSGSGLDGEIFETKDGGETFEKIISYRKEKRYNANILFELNKLFYAEESGALYFATSEGVYRRDGEEGTAKKIYSSNDGIVDIVSVTENGKNVFIVVENCSGRVNCRTRVFHTEDFITLNDITSDITADLPVTITVGERQTEYDISFAYLDATSTENIYLAQGSYALDRSVYGYGIEGIVHFDGAGKWLYGNNPAIDNNSKNQMSLKNRAWSDGNYKSYGIATSRQEGKENTVLYTTLTGVYHTFDGENFYQRYCDVVKKDGKTYYKTTGLNEQTTYGIVFDPFNKNNAFILNTDLGLIFSEDGGKTWQRAISGVPSDIYFNSYDMVFDKRREGVAYSVWSSRHDVPYSPQNESGKKGAFLYSRDGGKSWDPTYSSGIPSDSIPVKMSAVFPDDESEEAIIYVATFNRGFFVSYDSGKSFEPLNDGITPVRYNLETSFILGADIEAKDGRVFALTARSAYMGEIQKGEVFELKDGVWQKIPLPDGADTPRDIYFNRETLYISCTTNRKNLTDSGFINYGGGVYAYKDGEITGIFDESVSATGVCVDSKGTLFVSDINGNIYRKENGGEYRKIYDSFHSLSKGIRLNGDDELYLATLGGGLLKLENLEILYAYDKPEPEPNPDNNDNTDNIGGTQTGDGEEGENSGNTDLNKRDNRALIIGLAVAFTVLTAIIIVLFIFFKRRKRE